MGNFIVLISLFCLQFQFLFAELTQQEKALFEAVYAWDIVSAKDILKKIKI